MERKNYFEMLGLEFDPPEKNEHKITKAIEEWRKRLQNAIANETIDSRREQLQQELRLEADMTATMRDTKARNAEARALKEQRIAQLEKLIDILLIGLGSAGTPEVSNAQIRNVQQKLRLSLKTVTDTYTKKGFVVQQKTETVKLTDVFMAQASFNKLQENLEQLRKLNSSQYPWTSKVRDLYDLACFASGESESAAASFRKKRTTELCSIMTSWAVDHASDMSAQGHLLADLFTAGSSQVFNNEANRKKYDMSMERLKLREFFLLLKAAPDEFKKDHDFAESCIATIQKSFPDYNLALALYNNEAGLAQDPYEPMTAMIHISCGTCKTPAQFRTRQEAEKAKCATCGAELYIACPKCRKKVPAVADRCSCGFLISEMLFFEEYLRDAEYALKTMNLGEADRLIRAAEAAYPGHPKVEPLKKKIAEEAKRFQKPLDELKQLMADGMYVKAQAHLATISASMPQLRLDKERQIIATALKDAQNKMPTATMSPIDAANRCVEILEVVKDYQGAIDFLQSPKGTPRPVTKLIGAVSTSGKLTCMLTWAAAGDRGVQYSVVRKKNGIPTGRSDGQILADGLTVLEYKDTKLEPGVTFGYAVFASRFGNYSTGETCEVIHYGELEEKYVEAAAEDGQCRFAWALPANAIGVRILRTRGGIPGENPGGTTEVLTANAPSNYLDKTVTNGCQYGYRLQCVYPCPGGNRYSRGRTITLMPEEPPQPMRDVKAHMDGNVAVVSWSAPDSKARTVMIRETGGGQVQNMIGKVLPLSDISNALNNAPTLASANSTTGSCRIELPPNIAKELALVTVAGAKGIICAVVNVSSVDKLEINRTATRIFNGVLHIQLQKIPQYLEMIHYCVAVRSGKAVPWATEEDAKALTMQRMAVNAYKTNGGIEINRLPQDDLYISVIGQYKMPNGQTVYSETARVRLSNKPKEVITYTLRWGSGGLFGSKPKPRDCKLILKAPGKELPQLKLVSRTDGHIPMRLTDPRIRVLHVVEEQECPEGTLTIALDNSLWTTMAAGTELRLMMSDADETTYELSIENVEQLKVPKA